MILKLLLPRLAQTCKTTIPSSSSIPQLALSRHNVKSHTTGFSTPSLPSTRSFSTTNNPPLLKASNKNFPPRPKPPPAEEIEESFLKGSGPGGQKINKTNSAVQLKHLPTGIVVKCQATRSRSQNRTIARQLLADRLDDMTRGDESRSSIVGEVKRKKRASSAKKSRRKYRKLDEEKGATVGEALEEENNDIPIGELLEEENNRDGDEDAADRAILDKKQLPRT